MEEEKESEKKRGNSSFSKIQKKRVKLYSGKIVDVVLKLFAQSSFQELGDNVERIDLFQMPTLDLEKSFKDRGLTDKCRRVSLTSKCQTNCLKNTKTVKNESSAPNSGTTDKKSENTYSKFFKQKSCENEENEEKPYSL